MENYEFKYAFGNPKEIFGGALECVDSIEELNIKNTSETIILPQILGIYQISNSSCEVSGLLNELSQLGIISRTGEMDKINPELICIGYDPTITPQETLPLFLEGDVLNRLNVTTYDLLYELDFNTKPSFNKTTNRLNKLLFADQNKSVIGLDGILTSFKNIRKEYGLTREEAIGFEAARKLAVKTGRQVEISF